MLRQRPEPLPLQLLLKVLHFGNLLQIVVLLQRPLQVLNDLPGLLPPTRSDNLPHLASEPSSSLLNRRRAERLLRVIEHGVVNLVRSVRDVLEDGVRGLDQVDLEADVEGNLIRVLPVNRNDRYEVDEWRTILSVVDERGLAFSALREVALEV